MEIRVSKCDAIHILNWLKSFKTLCNDPKVGMHYLTPDIDGVMNRLVEEYKSHFADIRINEDGSVHFGTGKDYWWIDKRYTTKCN